MGLEGDAAGGHSIQPSLWSSRALELWLLFGIVIWLVYTGIEVVYFAQPVRLPLPRPVQITYSFCGVAYASNLYLCALRWSFMGPSSSRNLQLLACYISLLASSTYTLLWLEWAYVAHDTNAVLFLPSRWALYCFTMPAIWWILAHISSYSTPRKLYVLWLNWVMLAAGGLATVPWLTWGHKAYWMALSCAPFPELCFHMWRMITDAIESTPRATGKPPATSLVFLRVYGQLSYQFFPAIYFAALDGFLPLAVTEPLWSMCDWCLKMAMTSSLMEADYFSITQRRDYYSRLLDQARSYKTVKQLMLAMERKNRFLSAMSHELRTPLNGIIGMAEAVTMLGSDELEPSVKNTIEIIKLSGKRLLQLINDILDAAQMRKGNLVIKRVSVHESIDLLQLIDNVIELVIPQLGEHVELHKRVYSVPHITGDGGRITQVLFNLLSNACKFTAAGFVRIGIGYNSDDDMVFVYVRDTGCGIRAEDVLKVFGVFEQVDMSNTRHHGGTGLGLHFVKELVAAHWGRIAVKSKVGVGTLFTVRFPIMHPDAEGIKPPEAKLDLSDLENLTEPVGEGPVADELVDGRVSNAMSLRKLTRTSVRRIDGADGVDAAEGAAAVPTGTAIKAGAFGTANGAGGPALQKSTSASNARPGASIVLADPLQGTRHASRGGAPGSTGRLFHRQVYGQQMVLSVDDDPVNQMVVCNLLQPLGYKLVQAMNGREAVHVLKQCHALPDAMLLDCMMPGMSGYSVCRHVRAQYGYALPILMVSANSAQKQVIMGLEQGANDYITKPFHRDELHVRIGAHIAASTLAATEREIRMPCALLHHCPLPSMRMELAAGAEEATLAVDDTVVLHVHLWHLVTDGRAHAPEHAAALVRVLAGLRDACAKYGMAVCQQWGVALVFTPLPLEVPINARPKRMRLFSEHVMTSLAEAHDKGGVNLRPTAVMASGSVLLTCFNSLATPSRVMLMGEPVEAARRLSQRAPLGCILMRRSDDDPAPYNPCDEPAARFTAARVASEGPGHTLWCLTPFPGTLAAKQLDSASTQVPVEGAPVNGADGGGGPARWLCDVMADQQTLLWLWKRVQDADPDIDATLQHFQALEAHLEAVADETGGVCERHDHLLHLQKGILSSEGSLQLDDAVDSQQRNLSAALSERAGSFDSAGALRLAAAAVAVADPYLTMLAGIVGSPRLAEVLQGQRLTVPQLARMTEKELAACTGRVLTMKERIHVLIAARKVVETTVQ